MRLVVGRYLVARQHTTRRSQKGRHDDGQPSSPSPLSLSAFFSTVDAYTLATCYATLRATWWWWL